MAKPRGLGLEAKVRFRSQPINFKIWGFPHLVGISEMNFCLVLGCWRNRTRDRFRSSPVCCDSKVGTCGHVEPLPQRDPFSFWGLGFRV